MRQPGLEIYQEQMIVIALICAGIAVTIVVLTILAAIYIKLSRQLCLKELEYRRYFRDEGVFEGDRTELIEEITNHSFLPMFAVDIETHISSKIEIEKTIDTLNVAFEKLLDDLFQDTAWDVSSDISVLNTMLAQEGLTEDEIRK